MSAYQPISVPVADSVRSKKERSSPSVPPDAGPLPSPSASIPTSPVQESGSGRPLANAQPAEFDVEDLDFSLPVSGVVNQVSSQAVASRQQIAATKRALRRFVDEIAEQNDTAVTADDMRRVYQVLVMTLANNGSSFRAAYEYNVDVTLNGVPVSIVMNDLVRCITTTPRRFLRFEANLAYDLAQASRFTYQWGVRNGLAVRGPCGFDAADYCTGDRLTSAERDAVRRVSDVVISSRQDIQQSASSSAPRPGIGYNTAWDPAGHLPPGSGYGRGGSKGW